MVYIESISIHDVKQVKESKIKRIEKTGDYVKHITIYTESGEIIVSLFSDHKENLS